MPQSVVAATNIPTNRVDLVTLITSIPLHELRWSMAVDRLKIPG